MDEISGRIFDLNSTNLNKTCRMCLTESKYLQYLGGNIVVDGVIKSIVEMIKFCINIEILCTVNFPTNICVECVNKILSFYMFKTNTIENDSFLKSLLIENVKEENSNGSDYNVDEFIELTEEDPFNVEEGSYYGNENDCSDVELNEVPDFQNELEVCEDTTIQNIDDIYAGSTANEDTSDTIITGVKFENFDSTDSDTVIINEPQDFHDPLGNHETGRCLKINIKKLSNQLSIKKKSFQINAQTSQTSMTKKLNKFPNELNNSGQVSTSENKIIDIETASDATEYYNTLKNVLPKVRRRRTDSTYSHNVPHNQSEIAQEVKKRIVRRNFIDQSINVKSESTIIYKVPDNQCEMITEEIERAKQHRSYNKLFEKHAVERNQQKIMCKDCNYYCKNQTYVKRHQIYHETLEVLINYIDYYKCGKCRILYLIESSLTSHNLQKHSNADEINGEHETDIDDETSQYECGVCVTAFPTINKLKQHMMRHLKTFECPIENCGSEYNNLMQLVKHFNIKHINKGVFKCKYCSDESFGNFDELQLHLNQSCPEKRFNCSHCDKIFFTQNALRSHLIRATKIRKQLICQYCGKLFKSQSELNLHNRVHTGERPYKCTICGKAYKTSSMRTAHMDTHLSTKEFTCNICNATILTRVGYRNHVKRHGEFKHKCKLCEKSYFTKYHLSRHVKSAHHEASINTTQS